MTHVNNAEGEKMEMEKEKEPWREREPAAGSSAAQHRFLPSAAERDGNSAAAVDAAVAATTTPAPNATITCLEDFAFDACQNWSQLDKDFCITDDELEYEDELSLGSGTIAEAAESLLTGDQHNEQLLMEGG